MGKEFQQEGVWGGFKPRHACNAEKHLELLTVQHACWGWASLASGPRYGNALLPAARDVKELHCCTGRISSCRLLKSNVLEREPKGSS